MAGKEASRMKEENTPMFDEERQVAIGDMDITYAPEGLTLSGYLKMAAGPKGAEMARDLAARLNAAAEKLGAMEEVEEVQPEDVKNPFGKTFD